MNDIEESIKNLQKLLELRKKKTKNKIEFDTCIVGTKDIENLIQEYKELKKQMGKDLDVVYIKGVYDERDKLKSKIKEKIEELRKKQIKNTTEKLFYDYDINRVIIMLKELLEEGDK